MIRLPEAFLFTRLVPIYLGKLMGETLHSEKKTLWRRGRATKKSGTPHVPNWVKKRGGASFLGKNREGGASILGEKEWWGFKLLYILDRSLKPQSSIFIPNVSDRRVSPIVFPRSSDNFDFADSPNFKKGCGIP